MSIVFQDGFPRLDVGFDIVFCASDYKVPTATTWTMRRKNIKKHRWWPVMAGIFRKRESENCVNEWWRIQSKTKCSLAIERRGVFSNFWESDRCVFVNLYETAKRFETGNVLNFNSSVDTNWGMIHIRFFRRPSWRFFYLSILRQSDLRRNDEYTVWFFT